MYFFLFTLCYYIPQKIPFSGRRIVLYLKIINIVAFHDWKVYFLVGAKKFKQRRTIQSVWTVEYTDCSPTSVLDMTLNNLMVPVMLELCKMRSTPLLPSFPGPLCPGVIAPNRVYLCWTKLLKIWFFDNQTAYLCKTKLFKMEMFFVS